MEAQIKCDSTLIPFEKKKCAFLICGMKIDKKFRCLKLTVDVIKINKRSKKQF